MTENKMTAPNTFVGTSAGLPLWNYPVRKGSVLYLALEDDYHRLQERLYRMFGTERTPDLHFSVAFSAKRIMRAHQLGKGLNEQLQSFTNEYSDTRLIIIDTLQKVREMGGESYSYGTDYDIITQLKHFADAHKVCLLLVHHTRKQKADDRSRERTACSARLTERFFCIRKSERPTKYRGTTGCCGATARARHDVAH